MLVTEQGTGNTEMKRTTYPTFEVVTLWETRHVNGLLQSNKMQWGRDLLHGRSDGWGLTD